MLARLGLTYRCVWLACCGVEACVAHLDLAIGVEGIKCLALHHITLKAVVVACKLIPTPHIAFKVKICYRAPINHLILRLTPYGNNHRHKIQKISFFHSIRFSQKECTISAREYDICGLLLCIISKIRQIVGLLSGKILRLHNFYFSVCVILARVLQITQSATLQGVVRFLHLFKFGLVVLQNLFLEGERQL